MQRLIKLGDEYAPHAAVYACYYIRTYLWGPAYVRRRCSKKIVLKCHARTMMHSEADEAFKMNAHHVPLRQSVEEIRRGKE